MKFPTIPVAELLKTGEAEVKTGPFGTQLKASDYVSEGTPVINVRNIGFGNIREDKLEYIGKETVQRLASHLLRPEDIVFGRKGAVERHVFIQSGQSNWFQGSDCLRLRLSSGRLFPRFVSYYLLTHEHQQWMMSQCSHGATMASLNQDIISRIQLPCPPVGTQRRIASILSAYDDLIENNTRRIAILEEMARRIYEEWFVRFRFPGHEQVKMVESEQGLIPEGWKVSRIGSEFKTILGGTPSRSKTEYWENGSIPWINSGKVNELRIIEPSEFITPIGLKGSATKLMPVGTTVLAITGATLGQVSFLSVEMCANQSVVGIIDTSGRYSEFVYRAVQHQISEIIQRASGGAQQHINKEIVNDVLIVLPDDGTLEAFNDIVIPIGLFISNLLRKNANLRAIRDLLLPKLISGELDVSTLPEPEETLAA